MGNLIIAIQFIVSLTTLVATSGGAGFYKMALIIFVIFAAALGVVGALMMRKNRDDRYK